MEKYIYETKMRTKMIRPVSMILLKVEAGKEEIAFFPTGFFDDGFFLLLERAQNLSLFDTLP